MRSTDAAVDTVVVLFATYRYMKCTLWDRVLVNCCSFFWAVEPTTLDVFIVMESSWKCYDTKQATADNSGGRRCVRFGWSIVFPRYIYNYLECGRFGEWGRTPSGVDCSCGVINPQVCVKWRLNVEKVRVDSLKLIHSLNGTGFIWEFLVLFLAGWLLGFGGTKRNYVGTRILVLRLLSSRQIKTTRHWSSFRLHKCFGWCDLAVVRFNVA